MVVEMTPSYAPLEVKRTTSITTTSTRIMMEFCSDERVRLNREIVESQGTAPLSESVDARHVKRASEGISVTIAEETQMRQLSPAVDPPREGRLSCPNIPRKRIHSTRYPLVCRVAELWKAGIQS